MGDENVSSKEGLEGKTARPKQDTDPMPESHGGAPDAAPQASTETGTVPVASGAPAGQEVLAARVMRRLLALEKKVVDLKPSYWKMAIADSIKIAITATATLAAAMMTGNLNQKNILAGERIKDIREVRGTWVASQSTFQNYFLNAETSGIRDEPMQFRDAAVTLKREIDKAIIPSDLRNRLNEFKKAAEDGKGRCESTDAPEQVKASAKEARQTLDKKISEMNDAFDQALRD